MTTIDTIKPGLMIHCNINIKEQVLPMRLKIKHVKSDLKGIIRYHNFIPNDLIIYISQNT